MSWINNIKKTLGLDAFNISGEQIAHLLGLDKPEKIKKLISEHWPSIEPVIIDYVKKEQEKAGGKLSLLADVEGNELRVQIFCRKDGEKSLPYKTFTSGNAVAEITKLIGNGSDE